MLSTIYDFLSRFAWPLIWVSLVLTLIDAFDDHSETTEQLKEASGLRKFWLHTKRVRLWVLPIALGLGAILAQMGSETDEATITSLRGRVITPEQQKTILAELQNANGYVYFIIDPSVSDTRSLGNSLANALRDSGYIVLPSFGTSANIDPEVTVWPKDNPETIKIVNALLKAHIKASLAARQPGLSMVSPVPDGTVKIFIGVKGVDEN